MLELASRRQLLEALRPAEGATLTDAIGTTYTLDLLTLLTTPLAFSTLDFEESDGRPTRDPIPLLQAARSCLDKIHVFCESGMIHVPSSNRRLFGLLEDSVVEVRPPEHGVFHPKVWVLRFEDAEGYTVYRLLVSSRNLTADRSWDTLLVLEGRLREGERRVRTSEPLAEFVASLESMALRQPVAPALSRRIALLSAELPHVVFDPPEPFQDLRFRPMGREGWPVWSDWPGATSRVLAVSPFLGAPTLLDLDPGADDILVSRADSLQQIPTAILAKFGSVYTLADGAEGDAGSTENAGEELAHTEVLSGLHAKLYVGEERGKAYVWTGSANAGGALTQGTCIEFMVELRGRRRDCGVDRFISPKHKDVGFGALLEPYTVGDTYTPADPDIAAAEEALDSLRRAVALAPWHLVVTPGTEDDTYSVDLMCAQVPAFETSTVIAARLSTVTARTRLSNATDDVSVPLATKTPFESLTCFVAFRIAMKALPEPVEFIVNVPATGMPEDRHERLIRLEIGTRSQFLRLLLFMLASDEERAPGGILEDLVRDEGSGQDEALDEFPSTEVLETLLRALERDPDRIPEVVDLVASLRKAEDGETLIPAGLDAILQPIYETWKKAHA